MRRAARNTPNAFRSGFDARMAGQPETANPYFSLDIDHGAWLEGWQAADRAMQKEKPDAPK